MSGCGGGGTVRDTGLLGDSCLLIAEAGTAHGGDLARGRELIDAAAESGAGCVKFQAVYAREIIHPKTGAVELPGGSIDLFQRFKKLERPPEFYAALHEHTTRRGLFFLCTPFGLESARMLRDLGCRALKIASPELNHFPLLREVAAYGLPLIVSTGVSRLADIEAAVDLCGSALAVLLHCITAYPAPEDQYNLRLIPALGRIFGVSVGLSDHSLDPVVVPTLAVALGACAVEKHFTLSRTGSGLDDPIALEPADFARMCREVRRVERASDPLAELKAEIGPARFETLLGSGRKALADAESGNYATTRRSLHAMEDLPKGAVLSDENVAVLRTEKNLRPGMGPEHLPAVLRARLTRAVDAGQGILWEDLLSR